jgi:chromosome segregation ATPase
MASTSANDASDQSRSEDPTLKSEKIARTFDSVGRRSESLREQLDSIEFSSRNIEAIRTQFQDALASIDQTLAEIERTKVAQLEAERKLESLTRAHERLNRDRVGLRVERDALAVAQDEVSARAAELERMVSAAEAASSEERATLAERSAKLERTERELEDTRRGLFASKLQLPVIRDELVAKENRLREVEMQRAALNDGCDVLIQENGTLRMRIEEFVVNTTKLGRQLGELEHQRDELKRRLEEVETSLGQETAAHAKLKAAHRDAVETQQLSEANLQEKLAAGTARLETAERLLAEARAGIHEEDATIRELEQRVFENSLPQRSLEAQIADLEKDVSSARAVLVEAEAGRTAAMERSVTLTKSVKDKEVALHCAEHKIATLEARFEERTKATLADRTLFEEEIAGLMEHLEAESAARLIGEGALQAARQRATPVGR